MAPHLGPAIVLAALSGSVAACSGRPTGAPATRNPAELTNPVELELTLPTTAGDRFVLSALKGKVVILNFFTTGCLPCQALFDRFIRVQAAYGRRRVAVVGVAVDRHVVLVRVFAKTLALSFPVLVAGSTKIQANRTLRVRVVPTTLILDQKGRVRFMHETMITTRRLAQEVARLL